MTASCRRARHPDGSAWALVLAMAAGAGCLPGCERSLPASGPATASVIDEAGTIVGAADTDDDLATPSGSADVDAGVADTPPTKPKPIPCAKNSDCHDVDPERPYCNHLSGVCVRCIIDAHCGDLVCVGSSCESADVPCVPGATSCHFTNLRICRATGIGFDVTSCPAEAPICIGGSCRVCSPGKKGCVSADAQGHCNSDGSAWLQVQPCKASESCIADACKACQPGSKACANGKAMQCHPTGAAWTPTADCPTMGLTCLAGLCVDPCQMDFKTNLGALLSNCDRILVAPDSANATVRLAAQALGELVVVPQTGLATSAPLVTSAIGSGAATITLPAATLADTGLAGLAILRLLVDVPAQISSATGTTDATAAMSALDSWNGGDDAGSTYRIAAWPQTGGAPVQIVVVSVGKGAQPSLTITPSVDLEATTIAGKFGLQAGVTKTSTAAEVVVLQTKEQGADPTGTLIESDGPIVVAVRGDAIHAPDSARCVAGTCMGQGNACSQDGDCPPTCCGDAFQFTLRPVASGWSTKAWVGRLLPRGNAVDILRIVAHQEGTTVTLDPPIANVPTLGPGSSFDLPLTADVAVSASHGVALLYVTVGSHAPGPGHPACIGGTGGGVCAANPGDGPVQTCTSLLQCTPLLEPGDAGVGGPEIFVVPDVSTWLERSSFATQPGAIVSGVTVVRALPKPVLLDGVAIDEAAFSPIGGTAVTVARVVLAPGEHVIEASPGSGGVQVVWHGWSQGRGHAVSPR